LNLGNWREGRKTETVILLYVGFFVISNLTGISFLSDAAWAPYTTSNSQAATGDMWVEGNSIRWADGSTEYYIHSDNLDVVDGSSPGPQGAAWIEGAYIHWIDEDGDENRYAGSDTGSNVGNPGNIWLQDNTLHYVDANGNERALDTIY
jgi:hypothetical protein